ncbi:hypothetical protein BKP35_09940 [Anaerobacillus arseniciselenatis]|uniref:Histidine kinase domain-containing protein n=1 Tax=Anaerobacillus arseniciselenatis TaxID=85682 RepID=A0A1S2LK15_9BACI|nr:GHKL domain-containing protein [Anaerobacillus arseniciselenatis]OIJ12878.1 hypothetical protein BKP35_09940 [Anaerobacillus arseniciselenatis]
MYIVTLVLIVLIQILLVFFTITSIAGFQDNALDFIGIPAPLIFVVLLNFVSLYVLSKVYKKEEERKIAASESTHVDEFRSLVASVRSDRHDLNNHLTVISGLMKINNFDSANSYINEMIGEIRINNKALTIENPVLASMLYSKMDKYHREKIPFNMSIESEEIVKILPSTDLIRLISNLLDNAYEATMELPIEARTIQLNIQSGKEIKLIVQNSANQNEISDEHFESGFSTKEENRGYGLSIIREITEKYKGTMTIDTRDNLVIFEISLPKGEKNDY